MKDLAYVKSVIAKHKKELGTMYSVKSIGVFGSVVRGEQKMGSDIDILVEFNKPVGFFKFLECEDYLGKKLGAKVDMVSKKALKPRIGKQVMKEVVIVA